MKLLLLDQFSDMGGAQHGLFDLAVAIRDRGWRALAGLPGHGELFGRLEKLGIECRAIPCGPYHSGRKSAGDVARFLAGTPRLAGQIREMETDLGADLIYVNGPRLLPAVAWAKPRAPVLFHSHSFLYPGPIRSLAGRSLRRLNARVVGVCDFVAEPWRHWAPPERISVIYNGVERPADFRRGESAGPPRIACIGRIAPEKGQREFLQVAALIHEKFPGARFMIYGDVLFGDPGAQRYAEEVRAMAAALPVTFAGWVCNVFDALASIDLLLVPSAAHEATTRVILEAFAAGVPVVAMGAGGIPEVVSHGRNGYLASSVEEMAALTLDFLRKRSNLSDAAEETWQRKFRLDRYRQEMTDLLKRTVGVSVSNNL
ncbi:MAG TPA: glycosyltransferase family 4 protein [Verrucomicrobiae bacterium]|nr:glycosyltransferase family 4 protein [Verrucomicrobiae bacterium]